MNILLTTLISLVMTYEMPKLPYANNGLEPVISQATIDYHYGKHLQTYVNNLNSLVPSTEFEGKTVEEIVASAPDGAIFNNAGQVLNHTYNGVTSASKFNLLQDKSKLKVVAMLINTETGEIVNAAERAVGTFGTGINVVDPSEKEVKEVARYTIDGVQLSAPAKGINIVKMSDGTTRKVVVKQ